MDCKPFGSPAHVTAIVPAGVYTQAVALSPTGTGKPTHYALILLCDPGATAPATVPAFLGYAYHNRTGRLLWTTAPCGGQLLGQPWGLYRSLADAGLLPISSTEEL